MNLRTITGLCCASFLLSYSFAANAQSFDEKNSDGTRPVTGTPNVAVRSGRAPALSELVKRSGGRAAGLIEREGAINTHALPRSIEINALLDNQRPTTNVLANERSNTSRAQAPTALLSIDGYSNDDNAALVGGRVTPPDTNGDVGIDHYAMYVNLGWMFFNKSDGSVAGGPFAGNIFWQGFGGVCETQNAGDPIVLYDHLAGRWMFSQFTGTAIADGHQCVAISDGEDPAGPYTLYDFVVSPGAFNDYPKIGLWTDGYYMTTHEFGGPTLQFQGVNLTVFDRDAMLAGDPNAGFIQFSNVTNGDPLTFGTIAGNLEGPDLPPNGTCNYLVHATDVEAFGVPGSDRYRLWEACVDFDNPGTSTVNQISGINVPAFDKNLCGFSRDCIQQPGPQNLDSLAAMTLYRFNLRFFPNDGVLRGVSTTNVDVGGDRAGVQWIGIDIDPSNNSTGITDNGDQLGVIDFGDGENRWMGSATIDQDGNVGIGYTRASNSTFPGVYFTVHERGVDGPGAVQQESVCVTGTGSHEGANRWADYASASMDPVDQCTFWIANEYVQTTGNFEWNTRVCSFRIPSCGDNGGGGDDATFETGTVSVAQSNSSEWHLVNLTESFSNPVVVMGPPSFNGTQPTSIRVRNVTASSFEFQIDEWEYLDGSHITESISYVVVESGQSTIGGLQIEAGTVSSNSSESTLSFGQSFAAAPVVLTQVGTVNEATAVIPRVRNISANSFAHRIEEEEQIRGSGHANETLHYIAISPGNAQVNGQNIVVGRTADSVTHNFFQITFGQSVSAPNFIAGMQTRDGGDTSALRFRNLSVNSVEVKVEEEQSRDTETNHTTEVVGFMVIGN